jgi:hypothetical protein
MTSRFSGRARCWYQPEFFSMPTALDNGQRSPRKQLAAVVRRVLSALGWSPFGPRA